MNCKQGDLAIVIKGYHKGNASPNIGRIVRCVRIASANEPTQSECRPSNELGELWVTDRPLSWTLGKECLVPDLCLRPLRGDLSGDEIERKQPIASVFTA